MILRRLSWSPLNNFLEKIPMCADIINIINISLRTNCVEHIIYSDDKVDCQTGVFSSCICYWKFWLRANERFSVLAWRGQRDVDCSATREISIWELFFTAAFLQCATKERANSRDDKTRRIIVRHSISANVVSRVRRRQTRFECSRKWKISWLSEYRMAYRDAICQ